MSRFKVVKAEKPIRRMRQPTIRGMHRLPKLSCLEPRIADAVQREADKFNCYPSYIIAVNLAIAFGIDLDNTYKYSGTHGSLRRIK
jgi:hypothetical protein